MTEYASVVAHYREQAEKYGASSACGMLDSVVRQKEVEALRDFVAVRIRKASARCKILEVCCGNGYLLEQLEELGGPVELHGLELVEEMVEIAQARKLSATIIQGNVLDMPYADGYFDIVLSERGIINVLDEEKQIEAYAEVARVLRPGGKAALIEAFKEPLENLNRARAEFLLPPIKEPSFNNWYTKERWRWFLDQGFEEFQDPHGPPSNFLSSHYFVSRMIHDVLRPEGAPLRNTEFAKFFSEALPPTGDYSPVKIKYLVKSS